MPVTINGDGSIAGLSVGGLGNGGIVDAGSIASNAVTTAKIANNTVNASKIDLTDNYAFTGTFTTPNGYNLLTTKVDSSNTSYQNNVRIFDFTSYNSTYDVYFIDMTWYNAATQGSHHLYFKFHDTADNDCNLRYVSSGYSQDGSNAIPHNGTGTYFRPAFASQYSTTTSYQFYVYNSRESDTSLDAHITGQSSWYREGSGVSAANFSCYLSNDDKFGHFLIDADYQSSGGGYNGKVFARLYGVA